MANVATQQPNGILFSEPTMFRNRIINGNMGIDQRNAGAAQTITAAAALAYTVDRWYAYCTGANVTGQRIAGTGSVKNRYQFTGAASVTGIGFAQRIENENAYSLAGKTATLSVDLSNSLLTTVTWTAYYANTADTFGTLASPTRTSIASGTFTVSSTLTRYSAQISIPSAATTGVEIVLSVGAQISGTWVIGSVQIEQGTIATPFEFRPIGTELALCQRYYYRIQPPDSLAYSHEFAITGAAGGDFIFTIPYPVPTRIRLPAIESSTFNNASYDVGTFPATGWGLGRSGVAWASKTGTASVTIRAIGNNTGVFLVSGATFSTTVNMLGMGNSMYIAFNAEL